MLANLVKILLCKLFLHRKPRNDRLLHSNNLAVWWQLTSAQFGHLDLLSWSRSNNNDDVKSTDLQPQFLEHTSIPVEK